MPPVPACKLLVPVMTIARIKAAPQTGSSDTASLIACSPENEVFQGAHGNYDRMRHKIPPETDS